MRTVGVLALVLGIISAILGLISKLMLQPLNILPGGLVAVRFLSLTEIFLLVAIAFLLLELITIKKK